ncbi:MAG: triose-phosphate isomerase [Candidatus Omnitrophica bacterium]|nr:triose-phosphate isomerase [Candidatus Omnitrophota bacterium]
MRKTIIAGNWKMYKNIAEAIELANGIKRELFNLGDERIDTVLCPPFTALRDVSEVISESNILLGAQDVYWEEEGAFTGEVSPGMLKDTGCSFIIIGHSERRQHFSETNTTVNKKLKAVLRNGLTPIVCIGETLSQREEDKTFQVLEDHVLNGLDGILEEEASKIIIAYEPVWAIGTGKTATPQEAQSAHAYIRGLLKKMFNTDISESIRIQYGGSVKPDNIVELMKQRDIDGALVGGASLKIESFSQIVKKACEVSK